MTLLATHLPTVLIGLMLIVAVFLFGRMRLVSLLRVFSIQSLLLVVIMLVMAAKGEWTLYVMAIVTLVIKVWGIPFLVMVKTKNNQASQRLLSYLRPTPAMMVTAMLTLVSVGIGTILLTPLTPHAFITSAALTLVLLGIVMLIMRRDMYSQIIGFLMMENGISALGLLLTGGMPLPIELGIAGDVVVGVILMIMLSYRSQESYGSVDTAVFDNLKG